MKKAFILLVCFIPKIIYGISESDSLKTKVYNEKAISLLANNQNDSAIVFYNKLAKIYFDNENWSKYVENNNSLSKSYQKTMEYKKAKEFLLYNISLVNNNKLDSLNYDIGTTYNMLGTIAYYEGKYDNAIKHSEKSIEIYKKSNNITNRHLAILYTNLGVFYSTKKNYKKAFTYHNYSLELFLNEKPINKKYLISSYLNIGKLYKRKEQYDNAITFYKKAINVSPENKNQKYYLIKSNLAVAYQQKGNYEKSLKILFSILKEYKGNKREDRIFKHIGTTYYHMKEYKKALEYLNKSLEQKKLRYKKKHPYLAINNTAIGDVFYELNDYPTALKHYQQSIIDLCLNFNDSIHLSNPKLELISDKGELLIALRKKAATLAKINQPKEALETYLLSIALNESIGYQHSDLESRNFQYQETRLIYEKAMALAYQLYEENKEAIYLEKAFQIAERSKSSLLVQSLQDSEAHEIGGVPADLIEKEKELTIEISFYENKLFKTKNDKDKSKMEQALFHKREDLDKLIRQLEKDYPKYYKEKYTRNEIGIADVIAHHSENEIFLEYFYGTDAYYIIAIDHKEAHIVKQDYPADFKEQLKHFLASMNSNYLFQNGEEKYARYTKSAHALYAALLHPLQEVIQKKQLTISPDGMLSYIPFEALLTEQVNALDADYRKIPYLLNKHSIHYAFSAGLHYNGNKQEEVYSQAFAGYAPKYGHGDLQHLNWSQEEVNNAAAIFNGNAFTDINASKDHFIANKNEYKILHLAMHASADSLNPMHSRLIFGENSEHESLYAYELCNMNIGSELVVLSACETGAGQLINGEGVMSLARSFFYAGCPSVIMSQWQLDDRTSTEIMQAFYEYLHDGENKSEALRLAKLDFIKKSGPIKSNPIYWASIVAVGDPKPIHGNTSFPWYYGILLLPVGIYYMRRSKSQKAA